LCLSTLHTFENNSTSLVSHSSHCGGRTHINYFSRWGHAKEECHTKAHKKSKLANVAEATTLTLDIMIFATEYHELLKLRATNQLA